MNELVFVKENYNCIHASFMKNGISQEKIYTWYMFPCNTHLIHKGTIAKIKSGKFNKKIYIKDVSFDINAHKLYEEFPLIHSQPSWQIQLIYNYLSDKCIKVYRERAFSGLKNKFNKPLLVDISFQVNNRWYFIEYHGTHHFFIRGQRDQQFINLRKNMEIRRSWCKEKNVPYLEIPFYRQNELIAIVEEFLKAHALNN